MYAMHCLAPSNGNLLSIAERQAISLSAKLLPDPTATGASFRGCATTIPLIAIKFSSV